MDSTRQRSWVRRIFARWSAFYDHPLLQELYYRPVHRQLLDALPAGRQVLDAGCGTGQVLADLDGRGLRLVGLDLSAEMLRHARRRVPSARLVRGDCQRLPFPDHSFDLVLNTLSFHWYPAPRAALAEFHRVLRPGGRLLLAGIAAHAMALPALRRGFRRLARNGVQLEAPGAVEALLREVGFASVGRRLAHVGTWIFRGQRARCGEAA